MKQSASAETKVATMLNLFARPRQLVWRELHSPRPLDAATAIERIRSLACDPQTPLVAIEARGTAGQVRFLLGTEAPVLNKVTQHLGVVAVDLASDRLPVITARKVTISSRQRPLDTDALDTTARALLGALAQAKADEEIVLQVLLGPRLSALVVPNVVPQPVPLHRLLVGYSQSNPNNHMSTEARAALVRKVAEPGFLSIIRVGVRAAETWRRRDLTLGLLAALRRLQTPGVRIDIAMEQPEHLGSGADVVAPWRWPLRLNVREVAAVAAFPVGDEDLPGLVSLHPRTLAPVLGPFLPSAHRLVVAKSTAPGVVGLPGADKHPTEPLLTTTLESGLYHRHIIGPTGVGKSWLLANLILQHIERGYGAVVIEPKGDLVNDVLARVPAKRRDDVVVLDPNAERVVGLNPLAGSSSPELRADAVLAVFTSLFGKALGPRSTDILHACLLTLAQRPDAALTEIPRLLSDVGFRRPLVGAVARDVALGSFWAWYEALTPDGQATATAPLMNKLRALILKPSVRVVLGQSRPKFDVRQVFTERKILLVPLPVATLGQEGSALLGSLVVSSIWDAARERTLLPADQRQPVSVVLDECQQFMRLPTDLADALATSRGYGVGWTLAHQFLGQLPRDMQSALLANCRSRVAFQLPQADAGTLAKGAVGQAEQRPAAEDFTALPAYHVYASLFDQGQVQPYASGQTLPLGKAIIDPDVLRLASGERYGMTRDAVEAELAGEKSNEVPTADPEILSSESQSGRRRRKGQSGGSS